MRIDRGCSAGSADGAVEEDHRRLAIGVSGQSRLPILFRLDATAKEVLVVVISKHATHTVQGNRIDARVDETETVSYNPEVMPNYIVFLPGIRVKIKPQ